MKKILELNKGNKFMVDGVEYVALIDLESEGYDEKTDSYSYKIYAKQEKDINQERYFEIKFLEEAKNYNGRKVEFTEDDIYEIKEIYSGENDEN